MGSLRWGGSFVKAVWTSLASQRARAPSVWKASWERLGLAGRCPSARWPWLGAPGQALSWRGRKTRTEMTDGKARVCGRRKWKDRVGGKVQVEWRLRNHMSDQF